MSVVFDEVSAEVEPDRGAAQSERSQGDETPPPARWPGVIGEHERRVRRRRRLAAH